MLVPQCWYFLLVPLAARPWMKTYVRTVRKLATIFGGESSQNVAGNIAGDSILSPAILPGCCRNVAGDNFLIAGDIAGRLVMTWAIKWRCYTLTFAATVFRAAAGTGGGRWRMIFRRRHLRSDEARQPSSGGASRWPPPAYDGLAVRS